MKKPGKFVGTKAGAKASVTESSGGAGVEAGECPLESRAEAPCFRFPDDLVLAFRFTLEELELALSCRFNRSSVACSLLSKCKVCLYLDSRDDAL